MSCLLGSKLPMSVLGPSRTCGYWDVWEIASACIRLLVQGGKGGFGLPERYAENLNPTEQGEEEQHHPILCPIP